MDDHVFTENKEVKKVKKYFSKNKNLMYAAFALVFLLIISLIFIISSRKTVVTSNLSENEVTSELPGQFQQTASTKCDVELLIDQSGSMTRRESDGRQKLAWAKDAATAFVNAMSGVQNNGNIRIGLSTFGNELLVAPFNSARIRQTLTTNFASVNTAISRLVHDYDGSGTCIDCGLAAANSDVVTNSTDTAALKAVILLSDGWGNRLLSSGNTIISDIVRTRAAATSRANTGRGSGIKYYVVGYGDPNISRNYDYGTLIGVANDPDSTYYSYRPNVANWTQTFVDLANQVCRPVVPDCTNLTSDKDLNNLRVGETVNFSVTAGGTSPITAVEASVYGSSCTDYLSSYDPVQVSGSGTYVAESWTPTTTGPFTVYGRVWNDGIAECRADCVDGPPRYLCPSTAANPAVCKLSGVVTQPPALSCSSKQAYTSAGVLMSSGTMVQRGTQFRYRINYRNTSSTAQVNASLTDTLPSGVDYVSTNAGSCTNSSNTITCSLGTVAGNSTGYVEFNVSINQNSTSGTKTNEGVVVPNSDPSVDCTVSISVPTPTPTKAPGCSLFRVKTIKDFPSSATSNACNYIPQIQCSGTTQYDWLAQLDYGYEIVYSNSAGVVQSSLTQRGTVRSIGLNYCASPTPAPGSLPGFSTPVYLTNMPAGGSATITLTYVLPSGARAISTNLSGNRIAVYNVRAGQQVLVDGYTCLPVTGCSACTTTPNQAPVVSTSTYTGVCP